MKQLTDAGNAYSSPTCVPAGCTTDLLCTSNRIEILEGEPIDWDEEEYIL